MGFRQLYRGFPMTPLLKSVQCISPAGLHRMAYKEWGDPRNPNGNIVARTNQFDVEPV